MRKLVGQLTWGNGDGERIVLHGVRLGMRMRVRVMLLLMLGLQLQLLRMQLLLSHRMQRRR